MKIQNQNIMNEKNGKDENPTVIFESIAPYPEPVAVGLSTVHCKPFSIPRTPLGNWWNGKCLMA
jgi:hypothetical protein